MKTAVLSSPASRGIPDWIEWGKSRLAFLGPGAAREECELILESLLGVSRAELYLSGPAEARIFSRFREVVGGRQRRLPLAYLLGGAWFWDARLEVGPGVFIPRPETEGMIEGFLKEGGFSPSDPFRFLDLGTGSGAIALTLARLFPKARGVASDISDEALGTARRNAEILKVGDAIQFLRMDGLSGFCKESFDVIFSNPPYIGRGDLGSLEPEVRSEPLLALDGGEDGMDFYKRIAGELVALKRGGSLWVEIGWGQSARVRGIFEPMGFDTIKIFKDLNGTDRIVKGTGCFSSRQRHGKCDYGDGPKRDRPHEFQASEACAF